MAKSTLLCLTSPLLLTILLGASNVDGANILAILPSVWQSHYMFGKSILKQLADSDQNHSVTLVSGHSIEAAENEINASQKIREIHIEKLHDNWLDMGLSFDIEQAHQQSMLERFTRLIYAGTANVDLLLADANVKKLLRSDEKFDLLIIDVFLSDALLGLALYYNVPVVVVSPNGANSWLNRMIGNPQSSALDPSNFLPYTERMSFWERCANTMMGLFEKLTYNFFHMISQQAVYIKHFQTLYQLANNNTVPLPHHRDLTQNLSLALINSHPVIQYPRAFLPNVLPIGGIHLQEKNALKKTGIPNHLKAFIENSSLGTVYISFGADARTIDLAREKLDALFDVISSMEEFNFILKWESIEYPSNLPTNVLLNDWFPQEAILAHKNVKAFISACGLMSVLESINGLTPLLAIPIYPEQFVTATRLEQHGLAKIVGFDDINYNSLLQSLKEITRNESLNQRLIEARQLLHADYGTPTEKLLHYIDLVLRTGGADYLKTHAHHLNFLRARLFDVIAVLALGLVGIFAIPFLLICCILKRSYNRQSEAAAAANAPPTLASMQRSHSKLSLSLSQNAASSRAAKPANNVPVMTTTMSMPASPHPCTITRQASASTLWMTNTPTTSAMAGGAMSLMTSSTSSISSTSSTSSAPSSPVTPSSRAIIAKNRQYKVVDITAAT